MFDEVKNVILGHASGRGSREDHAQNSRDPRTASQSKDDGWGEVEDDGCRDKHEIDVFISCAAVSDFRVKKISKEKIKKTSAKNLTLTLEKNPDILDFVGHAKTRPALVIGFAAESKNLEKYAREKLQKKNCDLIIANDIESGKIFGADETDAIFVSAKKSEKLGKISKEKLAQLLAEKILKLS